MEPDQPPKRDESSPASVNPEESKLPSTESEAPKIALNSLQDIDGHLWRRIRLNVTIIFLLIQAGLWTSLFTVGRASSAGLYVVIPTVIPAVFAVAGLTFLLISVTRFGSALDIAMALLLGFSTLLADFSVLYWAYGSSGNFTENLTRLDAIYFSVGTLSTAGTGNISAVSPTARGLQTVQMILDIAFIVFAVSLALAKLSAQMQQKRG